MGTRRSRTGGDLEGCDSEIVQLEPVNMKWLDGLGKEDGLLSPESRSRSVSRVYKRSFSGFAAKLTDHERQKLASMEDVVSVFPGRTLQLYTTRSWDFMGFNQSITGKYASSDFVLNFNLTNQTIKIKERRTDVGGCLTMSEVFSPKRRRKREAEILTTEAIKDSHVPVVPGFSSRGPNEIAPDILKIYILAAYSPFGVIHVDPLFKRLGNFTILSGTFVSCPHAAGVAAYVKSFHPDWSPSAIQSAIMTTGLVYETFEQDYIIMLCNIGYDEGNIGKISGKISTCLKGSDKATPKDLNYSSMAAQVSLGKSFAINFPRTVTNVGLANSIYKAKILQNSKIFSIKVVPEALSFRSLNEKKSFSVTVTGKGLPNGAIVSAS
ncbi:subtilisin-like protease SBT4.3 [Citrus sinensis]|nr:subtilisin-like protease SBT4.3 [Citrus sinensis]